MFECKLVLCLQEEKHWSQQQSSSLSFYFSFHISQQQTHGKYNFRHSQKAKPIWMGPVRIHHSSHHFATQPSHSVDRAGWQAKMASIEFWIPWCSAHRPHFNVLVTKIGRTMQFQAILSKLYRSCLELYVFPSFLYFQFFFLFLSCRDFWTITGLFGSVNLTPTATRTSSTAVKLTRRWVVHRWPGVDQLNGILVSRDDHKWLKYYCSSCKKWSKLHSHSNSVIAL